MHRGCASDKTDDRNTCTDVNERCVFCNGSTCNRSPAVTQSSLSCIKCSTNVECAWGHGRDEAINCSPTVVFPNTESCFTYSGNSIVTRGCTLDNPQVCIEGNQNCRLCSGVGCNIENVITQSCKVCRSDQTEQCGSEAFAGFEEQCGSVVKYEDRGCYSKREG